jgi:hypothetical protein
VLTYTFIGGVKMFFKNVVSIVISFLFLSNNISFALSPPITSGDLGSGDVTRTKMQALGGKIFAAKFGPGSIDFDAYPDDVFAGEMPVVEGIKPVKRDYANPPAEWGNNPILGKTDIIEAFKYFRDNEADMPVGMSRKNLNISRGTFEHDKTKGQIPVSQLTHLRNTTFRTLIIHEDFVRMWNDIRKNDLWFEVEIPKQGNPSKTVKRKVSLAWALFYRIAKHEMSDLRKSDESYKPKSLGHFEVVKQQEFKINESEVLANTIAGGYADINDALWLWFLGSYCFGKTTQRNNYILNERLHWFFNGKDAIDAELDQEFPRLATNMEKRKRAIQTALLVNYRYYSGKDKANRRAAPAKKQISVVGAFGRKHLHKKTTSTRFPQKPVVSKNGRHMFFINSETSEAELHELMKRGKIDIPHAGKVETAHFSPDGRYLAVNYTTHSIVKPIIMDLEERCLIGFPQNYVPSDFRDFSPDSKTIIAIYGSDERRVTSILNLNDVSVIGDIGTPGDGFYRVHFSSSGKYITADYLRESFGSLLFDAATLNKVSIGLKANEYVYVSPDEKYAWISSSTLGRDHIVEIATKNVFRPGKDSEFSGFLKDPGHVLVHNQQTKKLYIRSLTKRGKRQIASAVYQAHASPDGNAVFIQYDLAGNSTRPRNANPSAIYYPDTGETADLPTNNVINAVRFSADGNFVLVVHRGNPPYLCNVRTTTPVELHAEFGDKVFFSDDGKFAIVTKANGMSLHDLEKLVPDAAVAETADDAVLAQISKIDTAEAEKHELVKAISRHILDIARKSGPGSDDLISAVKVRLWHAVNMVHNENVEIFIPQGAKLTQEVNKAIVTMKQRGVKINVIRYGVRNVHSLIRHLCERPGEENAKRIVVTNPGFSKMLNTYIHKNRNLKSLTIFKNVRFLNIDIPRQFAANVRKSSFQAKMIMLALLGRVIEKDQVHYLDIKQLITDILEDSFVSGNVDLDNFVEKLAKDDGDSAKPGEIRDRIGYFLDGLRAIKLIKKLGIQLRVLKEFWTYA